MPLQKVLQLNAQNVPQNYSPAQTSAGVASAGHIVALNAAGKVDESMLQAYESQVFAASEAIPAGSFVNVYNNGGTPTVRLANATDSTKPCNGWAPASISNGGTGTINFVGMNSAAAPSTLTLANIGQEVFLSTTSGLCVPANTLFGTGNLIQSLGTLIGVGSTLSIDFNPQIRAIG